MMARTCYNRNLIMNLQVMVLPQISSYGPVVLHNTSTDGHALSRCWNASQSCMASRVVPTRISISEGEAPSRVISPDSDVKTLVVSDLIGMPSPPWIPCRLPSLDTEDSTPRGEREREREAREHCHSCLLFLQARNEHGD